MVLSCIRSTSFVLEYESFGYKNSLTLKSRISPSGRRQYAYNRYNAKNNGVITWEFEELKAHRQYGAIGTCEIKKRGEPGFESYYFASNSGANSVIPSLAIEETSSAQFKILAASSEGLDELPYAPIYGLAAGVEPEDYQLCISNQTPYSDNSFSIFSTNYDPSRWHIRSIARGLQITHVFRGGNPAVWDIVFFEDGVEAQRNQIQSSVDSWREPPDSNPINSSLPSSVTRQRTFNKAADSQAVEVLVSPTFPHTNNVWLINLNEGGVEDSREIIFSFSSFINNPPPRYSLTCVPNEDNVCPDGTCEVICGNTICCYGSDGVAIASFPNTQ